MKLIADESFPLQAFRFLASVGYDITSVALSYQSIKDPEVLQLAMDEERLVLTFDRDFGELIFKKGIRPKEGLVYLRLSPLQIREAGSIVHKLLSGSDFDTRAQLTVYDGTFMRQKPFEADTGE